MTRYDKEPIAVVGAGSWGTALAIQLARGGRPVMLWARDQAQVDAMVSDAENRRHLPGIPFPDEIVPQSGLQSALSGVHDILIAVPSSGLRETFRRIAPSIGDTTRIAWATKGFEHGTGKLAHEVADEELGQDRALAVVSGPTFAAEVAKGLPSAITVASNRKTFAETLANALSTETFRAYTSEDLVGVEVGGAVKNPMAIAAGISDGLGFGANSRTALITRGLAEMMRLAEALGGEPMTLTGLAGVGDLILTCTDDQSRNRRCGLAIAEGKTLDQARETIGLIEGADAAREVRRKADELGVEMPITTTVCRVLHEGLDPKDAVHELMTRALKAELD